MSRILIATVAALAAATPAQADDSYTLKFYTAKEGDVTKVTSVKKTVGTVKYNAGTRKVSDEQNTKEEASYTQEVVAVAAGTPRAAKLRRTYHTLSLTDASGEKTVSPLAGKTVEVDRSKGKPAYTVDGKPPTDEQLEFLEGEFGGDPRHLSPDEQLPGRAVKVGDTWPLDKKKSLADVKGMLLPETVIDEDKATFAGKLVRAEKRDGGVYGVVEFAFTLPVKKYPLNEEMVVEVDAGSVVALKEVHTFRLDGGAPGGKVETTITLAVTAKLPDGRLEVKTTITGSETEEVVPKVKK